MHLAKHILKNMRESQPSSESPLATTVISAVPAPISGQILPAPGTEMKEKLIASVKKEVKQLMEEAVTKKFVHEESGGVTTLCAAVEACLGQGLRRRALGLFKTSSTTALLHKIAKHCPEAAQVSRRVVDADGGAGGLLARSASGSSSAPAAVAQSGSAASPGPPPLKKRGSAGLLSSSTGSQQHPPQPRYLWIRLALFERQLARIIDHLVANAARYYERDALVADPDYGSILSSLLVGPCALDFTRAKTADHFWTDPPADELVQRHRISAGPTTPPSCRRPILNFRRSLNASSDDSCVGNNGSTNSSNTGSCCKEYVESFHQNSKATLLYGKNNVMVQTKEIADLMPGYLSLHQMAQGLTIKWTPNQLMNGYSESENTDKSSYWKFALNVNVDEIVYVHCHQDAGGIRGGTLILVGQDGVQRPPIHFPKGGHLLAFLSCLETGLLPHGQLDPPLWSQRGTGKVFPRFSKTRRRPLPSVSEGLINNASTDRDDENGGNGNVNGNDPAGDAQPAADYVFRIANNTMNHQEFVSRHSLMERVLPPRSPRKPLASVSTASNSSDSSSLSVSMSVDNQTPPVIDGSIGQVASIALVCSTMKRQIISRAFYGWLAYCRHLSTVRTHLSGLVHPTIIPKEGASGGLTKEKWAELTDENGAVHDSLEVYRLTYYGGIEHEIRKEVWPYLLEYYSFGMDKEERSKFDANTRSCYEATLSEWLCVEAIVKQRDKEAQAASIAKLAQNAQAKKEPTECIEVYEDNLSIISDDPPMVSPDMSESDRLAGSKKASVDLTKTNAPSIEEEEAEKGTLDSAENGNTEKSLPKDNNEAVAEIRKLAEAIVPKPNGIGLHHCSVESGSMDSEPKTPKHTSVIVTNPSVDIITGNVSPIKCALGVVPEESSSIGASFDTLDCQLTAMDSNKDGPRSNCVSPASSNGGVYSTELVESFGLNLHRIEKDVQRCDRNYWYFTLENLEKLRNVMCTWVWEHLDVGYMQGMVDLAAVLLVLTDDEASAHACLSRLLKSGAIHNFPCGQAMDHHFANMRSLIQILDCEMYELMHSYGDYTHFYFCYRWFLLDFKRELLYQDVFSAWELLWAAKHVASSHMPLFLALALLETYRDIILANTMDFTDIIKFFNEMAERHDAQTIFKLARDLVLQVQTLIENK